AIADFVVGAWERRAVERRRVLATVLFTDLVDSTATAAELGGAWPSLLAEHNAVIRRELARFRGETIDTAGDGFFASGFDGPARAIRRAWGQRAEGARRVAAVRGRRPRLVGVLLELRQVVADLEPRVRVIAFQIFTSVTSIPYPRFMTS